MIGTRNRQAITLCLGELGGQARHSKGAAEGGGRRLQAFSSSSGRASGQVRPFSGPRSSTGSGRRKMPKPLGYRTGVQNLCVDLWITSSSSFIRRVVRSPIVGQNSIRGLVKHEYPIATAGCSTCQACNRSGRCRDPSRECRIAPQRFRPATERMNHRDYAALQT